MQKKHLQRPSGQKAGDNKLLRKPVNITITHYSDNNVSLFELFIICIFIRGHNLQMKYVWERDGTVVLRSSSFYQILGIYTRSTEAIRCSRSAELFSCRFSLYFSNFCLTKRTHRTSQTWNFYFNLEEKKMDKGRKLNDSKRLPSYKITRRHII